MFNIGGGELVVIALLALIVLGPQRLPGAARQIGKTLGDLRRLSTGFQDELRGAFDEDPAPSRTKPARDALGTGDAAPDASVDAALRSVSGQAGGSSSSNGSAAAAPRRRRQPLVAEAAPKSTTRKAPAKKAGAPKAGSPRAGRSRRSS